MRCKFALFSCTGASPGKSEKQECRRSHLRPFCNAIKVLRFPEFGLFVDVSEKKVTVYFMLFNVFERKTEVFMSW